jgi:organic hydroperoxide reductase OsmC/OhrA
MERAMSQAEKLLYTAKVHTTGGREDGTSRSDDGRLENKHSVPGATGNGTNPEQLFAVGWSTCFESAMAQELQTFTKAGVHIDTLAAQLHEDGATAFAKSWDELMDVIDSKSLETAEVS